jgi:aspartate carbamoyltransferase catalytic subunit
MLARLTEATVINAGDGSHEHPSQALLDMYTVRRKLGTIEGLRVGIVGDIAHSRVARSGALGFKRMGADVVLVAPPTLVPLGVNAFGCEVSYDLDAVIGDLDVVYLLRLQLERHRDAEFLPNEHEFWSGYALTRERLARMKSGSVVMHAGPMNRGIEIDWDAAEAENALIEAQVSAGVAVRMALLYTLMGSGHTQDAASGAAAMGEVAS